MSDNSSKHNACYEYPVIPIISKINAMYHADAGQMDRSHMLHLKPLASDALTYSNELVS